MNPVAGNGHPIHFSDLLQIALSICSGGLAYRRRSGVTFLLEHGGSMPVPFLIPVP